MKLILISTALLVVSMSAQSADAQTMKLQASVPFAFEVGKTHLPAGEYLITRMNNGVLNVHNTATNQGIFQLVIPREAKKASDHGKLVFHAYGDTYFLSQVWSGGDTTGCNLKTSKREAEMQRAEVRHNLQVVLAKR